jgi:hypothetical protein
MKFTANTDNHFWLDTRSGLVNDLLAFYYTYLNRNCNTPTEFYTFQIIIAQANSSQFAVYLQFRFFSLRLRRLQLSLLAIELQLSAPALSTLRCE